MRRYVFTGLGGLAGFLVGALIVGALVSGASIISNDAILISELLLGTIGAVLSMEQILRCPIVFMGLSLPDHGYHAPNENFDWGQASGGIVAFAKFLEDVAGR